MSKYIRSFLACLLVGAFAYACSNDENVDNNRQEGDKVRLSINLDTSDRTIRISGTDPDVNSESAIYSLEVLIFKPQAEGGTLDGYKSQVRELDGVTGKYKKISEIKSIDLTAGTRDIYVVANAPDNYFSDVNNFTDFKNKFEKLETQGRIDTQVPDNTEDPIGGLDPYSGQTNLTMCGSVKGVKFNNLAQQHYLGYTTSPGLGQVLNGNGDQSDPQDKLRFYVERLAARIAVKSIKFALPAQIVFSDSPTAVNYSYSLDSVFMMNVKTTSVFSRDNNVAGDNMRPINTEFAHGSKDGYTFLKALPAFSSKIFASSQQRAELMEGIFTRDYDITINDSPLWFYAFENDQSATSPAYPTYLVVGVRYNFKSAADGKLKTVKSYYPVEINNNGKDTGKADHNYIKRNYQYLLAITIKALKNTTSVAELKSGIVSQQDQLSSAVEVEQTVGRNLFPWTGNKYNK